MNQAQLVIQLNSLLDRNLSPNEIECKFNQLANLIKGQSLPLVVEECRHWYDDAELDSVYQEKQKAYNRKLFGIASRLRNLEDSIRRAKPSYRLQSEKATFETVDSKIRCLLDMRIPNHRFIGSLISSSSIS